jgi:glycine betaine/proline transport system ATP-binding protein
VTVARDVKIKIEKVCKIFGKSPQEAMAKVQAGMSKTDLLAQTSHVLGLNDISLEIERGELFVIMGLSGSGKSTLIRHFNRLIEPTAGRILVDGQDILTLNDIELRDFRRRKVSMVFQRFALLPHKTVLENVRLGLILDGMDKAQADRRSMEQIELVGLQGFENRYPGQLSGGMQQRVGLARALATDAEILLMDEAFSALDPLIRNDMQTQLKQIQARLHKTIVFITHDLDEALFLGDHIAILKDGELRQIGTGAEILLAPADDYVARFVRDVNRARIVTCGAIADPAVQGGPSEVASDSFLEQAFAILAQTEGAVTVRHADGSIAGGLTRQAAFAALAHT